MGNNHSAYIKKINFEDMQHAIKDNEKSVIINTLTPDKQQCLIKGTITIEEEIKILNHYLSKDTKIRIIIYGINACDPTMLQKYNQLMNLGFYNIYIYPGGMFEWLLLQDIYGEDVFPTTTKEKDLLRFKGRQQFNIKMIDY